MPYEIDMLDVGNADAIILRYLNDQSEEYIVVIDAGKTKAHGEKVVDHIQKHTVKKSIDLAISTHPDKDHINGFFYVVEHIHIEEFWIHDPGAQKIDENEIAPFFGDAYFEKGLKYVMESLNFAKDLITIIDEKGIFRQEPFEGLGHAEIPIKVLGPSRTYYKNKLKDFRDAHLLFESVALEKGLPAEFNEEEWNKKKKDFDRLRDRSSENNSSTILYFYGDNKKVLFTSDIGPEALEPVISKYDLKNLDFLDVPHHGSKNNLTTEIMDELNPKTAYISCEGNYPHPFVVEYLNRKWASVFSTKIHGGIRHSYLMPLRYGWQPIKPM